MRFTILASLTITTLAACIGIKPTRIYAGSQLPLAGICNPASRATLTTRGDVIVLSPGDGTVTLTGRAADAAFSAQTILSGVDHKPYPITFTGRLAGQDVSGTLNTPRCRYTISLHRTQD